MAYGIEAYYRRIGGGAWSEYGQYITSKPEIRIYGFDVLYVWYGMRVTLLLLIQYPTPIIPRLFYYTYACTYLILHTRVPISMESLVGQTAKPYLAIDNALGFRHSASASCKV
jgi:hypothetical protein